MFKGGTMLYLANPCGPATIDAMRAGLLGFIDTPAQGNERPAGITWAADNGCFGRGYPGDEAWLAWLHRNRRDAGRCLFATAPDVVGDAAATLERSRPFLARVRALGYPVALVAQDGLEDLAVPWDEFDALFIGGSTDWKLGPWAALLAMVAHEHGKHVHMGRVNSLKRYRYAVSIGCDSVDGTYLVFAPSKNLPRLLGWVDTIRSELAA
jgi:hypothetical protein